MPLDVKRLCELETGQTRRSAAHYRFYLLTGPPADIYIRKKETGIGLIRLGLAAIILLTVVGLVPGTVSAGETDSTKFRIQDYIPDRISDFEWKLDGLASARDGSGEQPTIHHNFSKYYREAESWESNSRTLEIANNWRYRYESRQGFVDLNLGLSTDFYHDEYDNVDSTVDTIGLWQIASHEQPYTSAAYHVPLAGEIRRYVFSNTFVTAVGDLYYSYYRNKSKELTNTHLERPDSLSSLTEMTDVEEEVATRRTSRNLDFVGEIRLGWGRVYEGKYAATALYVTNELKKARLLARDPGRSEMLSLTKQIHAYREGHSWDRREYRASSLQAILANLHSAGLIADESAYALLCVEDVLDYFPAGSRRFGWDIQAGFGGHDRYYNYETDQETRRWTTTSLWNQDSTWIADTISATYVEEQKTTHTREFAPTDHLVLQMGYYRPLSPRWQFNFSARSWWFLNRNTQPENIDYLPGYKYWRTFDRVVMSGETEIQYLYDARTALLLNASLIDTTRTDKYRSYHTEEIIGWKIHSRIFQMRLGGTYRMTPSTTLSVNWQYLKYLSTVTQVDLETRSKSKRAYLSFGITHWLF